MKRRNFLVGVGGTAIGASALVGSGAFSRVESDRAVDIAVAPDDEAYLGLKPLDSKNSKNYVALDEKGHLFVQIDGKGGQQDNGLDGPIGKGVNSDSTTWFEAMFKICNNGKDEADIAIDVAGLEFHDSSDDGINGEGDPIVDVRTEDGDSILFDSEDDSWYDFDDVAMTLEVGECETMKIVTQTYSIDATMEDEELVKGDATVVAVSDGAGEYND